MLKYSRHGVEFTLDPNTLPGEAIAYLLQYGFAQSLQDCVAGRAKKVRDEGGSEENVVSDEIGTMQKRLDAIIAGSVNSGTRGPRDPFGSMVAKVAKEFLAAYARSKGKKLPKAGTDEMKELLAKFTTAKKAEIEAEAKLRLERNAEISDESDEIFD